MHMTPIVAGRYSTSGCLLWHEKGENMEITAIAIKNLHDKGKERRFSWKHWWNQSNTLVFRK